MVIINLEKITPMTVKRKWPLDEDRTKNYVVVDEKVGVMNKDGTYSIPPKFTTINRDISGNYLCEGYEHNKEIYEVYDSNFNLKSRHIIEE